MPSVPAPNFSKDELEERVLAMGEHYANLKDTMDLMRWKLIQSIKDAARAGISEERITQLSGLKAERVHQIVRSFTDPRSVRV